MQFQNPGPGQYESLGMAGLNTMCGTMPLCHWASNSDVSSCCPRCASHVLQAARNEC